MRGQETDNVISGPMRGFEKKLHSMAQTDTQTDGHGASMTDPAQRAESVKRGRSSPADNQPSPC